MAGRTTLVRSLVVLFIIAAVTISTKAADVSDRAVGITRAAYRTDNWNWHSETSADGPLRPHSGARQQIAQGFTGARIGGSCTYRDVPGTVTIVRVEKTAASIQQATTTGGPGYEGFEISFSFVSNQPIAEAAVRDFARNLHVLRLTNSWYPGPRYIEKYHLDPNRTLSAVLKVRSSGACAPMLYAIAGVNRADYFERAK